MWLIPGKTKVQTEIFKGVYLTDVLIGVVAGIVFVFLLLSNLPFKPVLSIVILFITALLLIRIDEEPNYKFFLHLLKYLGQPRKFVKTENGEKGNKKDGLAMEDIIGFSEIKDGMIHFRGQYYGVAIEIPPIEFKFFSAGRRNNAISNGIGRVLRNIHLSYSANIVKIERPIRYEEYVENEYAKLENLRATYERGMLTEDELKARVEVLYDRINNLEAMCNDKPVVVPFYYVVLYDSDPKQLKNQAKSALNYLRQGEMSPKLLDDKELAVFLKYSNQLDFDEADVDNLEVEDYAQWAYPDSLKFNYRTIDVNRITTHNMRVMSFPMVVGDSWLASVMSIPATKVMVKCKQMDRQKAIRGIDRSLAELRGQLRTTGVDSRAIEIKQHIQSLTELLGMLQSDNETLLSVNVYVTAYDLQTTRNNKTKEQPLPSNRTIISNMRKQIRRIYREDNMRLGGMDFEQLTAFVGSQVSGYDPCEKSGRGIPSNTVGASFPWIFAYVSDKNGIKLGSSDGVPVFIDFFRRDSERVNSNMVIIGKSGSGKSYATKSLLANLAADDAKIFILDPENEYTELAKNLHGKFINVGNSQSGRLNPFHIITTMDDEADGEASSDSYATHLQFLEEFFKQILPDCDKDALEYLNSLVDRMYINKGITPETDLRMLRPEDYPIFDDLYDEILQEFQKTDNEYIRTMLRTLMNYVAKFSAGGRNSTLWNGPSTITTEENFSVFNFQSLLANRNGTVANAQMLLVLKYIDNEIIKNRDYNIRNNMNRKVVVVIDEAHVFIDEKYPIALDFMFQLAKRIRKYNGMQIVITQNIKDFVGTEELARKSTAIINACQYSFIFSLAPNDMEDLCKLYEKAGEINQREQEEIIAAPRGQAFTVLSPVSRSTFKVEVPAGVREMFKEQNFQSHYFTGEQGVKNWESFIGDSREIFEASERARLVAEIQEEAKPAKSFVLFEEMTEEELELMTEEIPEPVKIVPEVVEEIPEPVVEAVPQVQTQTPVFVSQEPSKTEQMLTDFIGRFSYDVIMKEIKRTVREELEEEMKAKVASAPVEEMKPAAEERPKEQEEVQGDILGNIFDTHEETSRQEPVDDEEEDIFAALFGDSLDEDDDDEDDSDTSSDDEPFDIFAFFEEQSAMEEKVSVIEKMEIYGDTVMDISLDDLALYNKNRSQRG